MVPAIAGVGKCTNSIGTTKKPNVLRLPHHAAASHSGSLDIVHRHDFVGLDTAGCLHLGRIALALADQGAGNG